MNLIKIIIAILIAIACNCFVYKSYGSDYCILSILSSIIVLGAVGFFYFIEKLKYNK